MVHIHEAEAVKDFIKCRSIGVAEEFSQQLKIFFRRDILLYDCTYD